MSASDQSVVVSTPENLVVVPIFDCGDGYRQLEWRETIEHGDEFLGGTDSNPEWLPSSCIGDAYRPSTANSIYAPYAIHRRNRAC